MDQKKKYDDSLEMVSNIETKTNELLTRLKEIPDSERKNIETALPSSLDFVKLISQIDAVAANYGISIKSITSKEVGSSVGTSVENAEPPKTYHSSIIGFSFNASYDEFNAFMEELEKSLRILDIRSVKIVTQEDGRPYSYQVEFETYWFK